MPFSEPRITWRALIAGALVLVLTGCAAVEHMAGSKPSHARATAGVAAAAQSPTAELLTPVETIAGGQEGNFLTGTTEARLRRPVSVAARGDVVYVLDADAARIYQYDRFTRHLSVLSDVRGVLGGDAGDIYVAPDRSYYLADTFGARVLHFDRDGRLQQVFQDVMNLARPVSVSVDDASGDVYVADGVMDHVLVFNRAGKLIRALGGRGTGPGEFLNITAMARGSDGVYVTARLAERGQLLGEDGRLRYTFEHDALVFPVGVAVDAFGRVFVSDFFDNHIKVFKDGKLVATAGGTGAGPGRFKGIADVYLDGGFLYVADSLNGRIQVLRVGAPGAEPAPLVAPASSVP